VWLLTLLYKYATKFGKNASRRKISKKNASRIKKSPARQKFTYIKLETKKAKTADNRFSASLQNKAESTTVWVIIIKKRV
jgi:hypothetical protein